MIKIYENLDVNDLDGEIWKSIKDYPDYQVSNFGRVESLKFGKEMILNQCKNNGGYFIVGLCKNGKEKTKLVHRLVFETHNYKLELYEDVHHIDENKENNVYDNLKSISKSEHHIFHSKDENNSMFGKYHSEETRNKMSENTKKGEKHPNCKLTEEQVTKIKILLLEGNLTQQEIADMFGVSQMTISKIKNKKVWK